MNEPNQDPNGSPTPAFFKIWTETVSKMAQAVCSLTPNAAPPEMLRQMRTGIMQSLSQSWGEFLRSPEFLQGNKQMMDNAIVFRKLSTDLVTRARRDFGVVGQEDLDGVIGAIRHLESRVLERLDGLSSQLTALEERLSSVERSAKEPRTGRKPQSTAARRRGRAGQTA